jgi:hypothetical protein
MFEGLYYYNPPLITTRSSNEIEIDSSDSTRAKDKLYTSFIAMFAISLINVTLLNLIELVDIWGCSMLDCLRTIIFKHDVLGIIEVLDWNFNSS